MITATVDMTGFTAGMAGLVQATGATMKQVVEKETGELIKMLVRLSPPKSMPKATAAIRRNIDLRFTILENKRLGELSGSGDVRWLGSNDKYLFGIRENLDMRKAGASEIVDQYLKYHRTRGGVARWVSDFKHNRKVQKVAIDQRVVISQKGAADALKLIVRKFGKLKAAWLDGVFKGVIRITGGSIPAYVTNHSGDHKGRTVNELNVSMSPAFTIISQAAGVGSMHSTIAFSINARMQSMKKNAELFTSGRKHLGDYANGKATVLR
jgi:hypothetical protein